MGSGVELLGFGWLLGSGMEIWRYLSSGFGTLGFDFGFGLLLSAAAFANLKSIHQQVLRFSCK